jgi:bifunctional non-homologous end joining protein LigD
MIVALPHKRPSNNDRPRAVAASGGADALKDYRKKRDFSRSPEPPGPVLARRGELEFVVQKHAASRLHYDFRLELDGVMLSWAVPKGPSYDSRDKRMAVRVEDHPIAYNSFEGTIPAGQYGAGKVIIWDRGRWEPVGDARAGLDAGKLVFQLHGHKLAGLWELVRIGKPTDRQVAWILFKKRDAYERPRSDYDVVTALPDSVVAHPLPPATRVAAPAALPDGTRRKVSPKDLPGAVKARPPDKLSPQLATPSNSVPAAGTWIFEIKFDGYRLLARCTDEGVAILTRGGHDWTAKAPALARALAALKLKATWLDGEAVVLGSDGLPDFNALQNAFDTRKSDDIVYFVFDAPFFEGYDLRAVPLQQRRQLLRSFMSGRACESVRFSEDFAADAQSLLQSAQRLGLEGVMAKRADAPYVSARTETWLKLKTRLRQEFVVIGFSDRDGDRSSAEVGALRLGVWESGNVLVPVGSVGTGWDARTAGQLKARLLKLETPGPPEPLSVLPTKGRWSRREVGATRWVKPQLVIEVAFAQWTPEGQIRHATFVGVRADKQPRQVRREQPTAAAQAMPAGAAATKVSHPERVVDPSTGLTKLDLVRYYESVGAWMAPHLAGRPCSLVRGPNGIDGQLFFQKHDDKLSIPGLRKLDAALWPGHEPLLEVPTAQAIAEAAQMNVIEFHTWNAKARAIERPDRVVFDIDPGEGVPWKQVQEAALLVRSFLEELRLKSWLKTSGGKGLHVVVPLLPRDDWDSVRGFAQAVVQHLARIIPGRFVAVSGAKNRVGRIFVDYLRNGHGATTAAAFSARARPGLGVSMPVAWDELAALKSGAQWTIATAREHLSFQSTDPWAEYWTARQTLTQARRVLDKSR